MVYSRAAGLNVAWADRNVDGLPILRRAAPALHDRVKTIPPEAIVFFPLPLNESQSPALAEDSLASRITFSCPMLPVPSGLSLLADAADWRTRHRLCRNIRLDQG
jgi:hypothetical protein